MSKQGRWEEMGEVVTDDVLDLFAVVAEPEDLADAVAERFGGRGPAPQLLHAALGRRRPAGRPPSSACRPCDHAPLRRPRRGGGAPPARPRLPVQPGPLAAQPPPPVRGLPPGHDRALGPRALAVADRARVLRPRGLPRRVRAGPRGGGLRAVVRLRPVPRRRVHPALRARLPRAGAWATSSPTARRRSRSKRSSTPVAWRRWPRRSSGEGPRPSGSSACSRATSRTCPTTSATALYEDAAPPRPRRHRPHAALRLGHLVPVPHRGERRPDPAGGRGAGEGLRRAEAVARGDHAPPPGRPGRRRPRRQPRGPRHLRRGQPSGSSRTLSDNKILG